MIKQEFVYRCLYCGYAIEPANYEEFRVHTLKVCPQCEKKTEWIYESKIKTK